jgi:hypothetical protein
VAIDTTKRQSGQPRTTFGNVVTFLSPTEGLTGPILGALDRIWTDVPIEDILDMSPLDRFKELLVALPDDDGHTNAVRQEVNQALLTQLPVFLPNRPATPTQVNVTIDKTPGQMSLEGLLTVLEADHGRYGELKAFIEGNPELQSPLRQTASHSYAWVIPGSDNTGINVELTMSYISTLQHTFAVAQELYQGRRPITLRRAIGQDLQAVIHPFTGMPVHGLDKLGFDFAKLDAELHEALLWARITGHPAWPSQITDLWSITDQLITNPSSGRWPRILAAYQAAVSNDETQRVSRFWPKDLGFDKIFTFSVVAGVQQHDEVYYRRLVEEAASLNGTLSVHGNSNSQRGGAYENLSVHGNSHTITNVVIVGGGSVHGNSHGITVFLPPRVHLAVSGNSHKVTQTNMSWHDLAKRLGLI